MNGKNIFKKHIISNFDNVNQSIHNIIIDIFINRNSAPNKEITGINFIDKSINDYDILLIE
jgi:hypothetical protein